MPRPPEYSMCIIVIMNVKMQFQVPGIAASDNDKGDNGTEGLRFSLNVTDGPICISNQYPVSVYICNVTDRETQDTYYLSVGIVFKHYT